MSVLETSSCRLTVATYNVGLLKILWHEAVPLAFARSQLLTTALPDLADRFGLSALALQEVWSRSDADRFVKAFQERNYICISPKRSGWFGSGMLLFVHSSVRVNDYQFYPFQRAASWDQCVQKGLILANLQVGPELQIALGNVHLQALTHLASRGLKLNEVLAHKSQVEQVRSILKRIDSPLVLLGDLNVGPPHHKRLFRRVLQKTGLSDVLQLDCNGKIDECLTWSQDNPLVEQGHLSQERSGRIDHCLVRESGNWGWRTRQVTVEFDTVHSELSLKGKRVPLSDHFLLAIGLEAYVRAGLKKVAA